MKLNYITIIVENLDDSVKFYTELVGLKVLREINPSNGRIVFLANDEGETMLELAEFKNIDSVETKSLTLSFQSLNLESTHQKALDLGFETSGIINQPPKPKHFHLTDPNGITIEFSN